MGIDYKGLAQQARDMYGTPKPAGPSQQDLLNQQSRAAGRFAGIGEAGYGAMTEEMAKDRQFLRDIQSGRNSISAEQLRQGLQQLQAQQMSMAASARPGMAPMAARTAMVQSGRMGTGMSGQQALAGIAERQAAAQALAQMNQGQRGQDLQAALGSRQNAMSGLGAVLNAQTQLELGKMQEPSWWERGLGLLGGLGQAHLMAGGGK